MSDPRPALGLNRDHRSFTDLDKSLPARAAGLTASEFLASAPRLSEFWTPILVLEERALAHNIERMAAWVAEHHVGLAPHGKTTMAPQIWRRQLDAGAWGITVANTSQLRVALDVGVGRVMLANSLVDPRALRAVQAHLAGNPFTTVVCWADSVDTVRAMTDALEAGPPIDVLVEMGVDGGRTGARTVEAAVEVADAILASEKLRLRGVAGYEGAIGHGRAEATVTAIRSFLQSMAELHRRLSDRYSDPEVIVTAGGSSYFDLVVDELAGLAADGVEVLLRAGAYVVHDDGIYRGESPLSTSDDPLRSAMYVYARVVSRPEPGLALLDAGKRDLPFDEGMPEPQGWAPDLGEELQPLDGAELARMNDQHAFLILPPDHPLRVGNIVRLGLSHPCTALDKWRIVPIVTDVDDADPTITDIAWTCF